MNRFRQVTSSSNDYYKLVRKMMARRDCRQENGQFVAEGRRLVEEALLSGMVLRSLLLGERFARSAEETCERLGVSGCEVYLLSDRLMDALGDVKTSQGVLGVFELPVRRQEEDLSGEKKLLLCSLQDPGNVGAILRTAQALGLSRVLLSPDCPDLYSCKVLRASMGGVFRCATTVVRGVEETIGALRASGRRVYAAAIRGDAREIGSVPLDGDVCIVIGNEGAGLPARVVDCCDGAMVIPMPGRAQSLNAAMAAGILIWEMTKGWQDRPPRETDKQGRM